MAKRLLAVVLLFGLSACSQSPDEVDTARSDYAGSVDGEESSAEEPVVRDDEASSYSASGYASGRYASSDEEFDEDAAREEAEDEVGSESYDYSYGCTEDCSGHQAGWGYQAEKGYGTYPSGKTQSFEEGRMAFDEAVDERVEDARSEWEDENNE